MTESLASNATNSRAPLVVDLDGSLVRTDSLHEALIAVAKRHPTALLGLIPALSKGKAEFKKKVADLEIANPLLLPYRSEVLELIRGAVSEGREVFLVSASDDRQVQAVASHLDCFTEAIGTNGAHAEHNVQNLAGRDKAALLVDKFGRHSFDYVGDSPKDLEVWPHARNAYVVAPSKSFMGTVRNVSPKAEAIGSRGKSWRSATRALRPHQWAKNTLIFMPVVAAQELGSLAAAVVMFIAFSLAASGIYVLNDLLDLESDRSHPRKRQRPFAAGDLSVASGVALSTACLAGSLATSLTLLPPMATFVLLAYLVATTSYSFRLKRVRIVDIWILSALYTTRILAGAAATGIALSPWMLAFSVFIFFSLAAVKRWSELKDLESRSENETPGRGYTVNDVPLVQNIAISSGYAAVLVFSLYINSAAVAAMYRSPTLLWLIPAILLFWVTYVASETHAGNMHDDPVVFAVTDRKSILCAALMGICLLTAATVTV